MRGIYIGIRYQPIISHTFTAMNHMYETDSYTVTVSLSGYRGYVMFD